MILGSAGQAQTYNRKVLNTNPYAYWPFNESSGTVAQCLTNTALAATYVRDVSVMGTETGIGDGETVPTFDGANDAVYLGATARAFLNSVFNPDLGSWAGWLRVSGVGVWTDGTARYVLNLFGDGNNYIRLNRHTTNNRLAYYRCAGASSEYYFKEGLSSTIFMHAAITWDHSADEVIYYLDGSPLETDVGLVAWNAPSISALVMGAADDSPLTSGWSGGLGKFGLWNRVLAGTEVSALAVV